MELMIIPILLGLLLMPTALMAEECTNTVRDGKIVKICDGVIFDRFGKKIGQEQERLEFGNTQTSFGWRLNSLWQDFGEWLESDPIKKAELKLQHAEENQLEIERLAVNNEPIPRELEDRRLQKILEADVVVNRIEEKQPELAQEKSGVIEKLRLGFDLAINAGELNEIRIAVSEFLELRNVVGDNQVEKLAIANSIDQRINGLDLVQKYCIDKIDSLVLSEMDNPYQEVQRICPKLGGVSQTDAQQGMDDAY